MTTVTAQRQAKIDAVTGVRETLGKATSFVLLGFRGIDVLTVTELRARFRKAGVEYRVLKNKLIKQALKGGPLENDKNLARSLVGETGVAFSFEDPTVAAKIVRDFRKENEEKHGKLEVKLAVLDTEVIPGNRVESDLASMPGKDELRAMLLATMQAPAQNLVVQLAAPLQNLVYALDARRRQLEETG